jgi:hypothetical protein
MRFYEMGSLMFKLLQVPATFTFNLLSYKWVKQLDV